MNTIIIFSIFVIPVILLYFKIIPIKYRAIPFMVGFFLISLDIYNTMTLKQLGIDNISKNIMNYAIFTLLGVFVIIAIAIILKKKILRNWWKKLHFQFFFIPVSIVQEIAYRGYLIPKLSLITNSAIMVISINAILFFVLHLVYTKDRTILGLTIVGGIGFAWIYYYFPNLILVSISHMILNFVSVLFGFFRPGDF